MRCLCEACGAEQVVEEANVSVAECEACGEAALVPHPSAARARAASRPPSERVSDRATDRPGDSVPARRPKATIAGLGAGDLSGGDAGGQGKRASLSAETSPARGSTRPTRPGGFDAREDAAFEGEEDELRDEVEEARLAGRAGEARRERGRADDVDEDDVDDLDDDEDEEVDDGNEDRDGDEGAEERAARSVAGRRPDARRETRRSAGPPPPPPARGASKARPVEVRREPVSIGQWLEARGPTIAAFLVASAACFVIGRWTVGGGGADETATTPAPVQPPPPPRTPEYAPGPPALVESAEAAPELAPKNRKKKKNTDEEDSDEVTLSGPVDESAKLTTDGAGAEAEEPREERAPSAKGAGDELGPFDASVVTEALARAAKSASTCAGKGPNGSGSVSLTVMPDGTVEDVYVSAPFDGTEVGACVLDHFRFVRVPAFSGAPVKTYKSFVVSSDRSVEPTPVKLRPGEPPRPLDEEGKG